MSENPYACVLCCVLIILRDSYKDKIIYLLNPKIALRVSRKFYSHNFSLMVFNFSHGEKIYK